MRKAVGAPAFPIGRLWLVALALGLLSLGSAYGPTKKRFLLPPRAGHSTRNPCGRARDRPITAAHGTGPDHSARPGGTHSGRGRDRRRGATVLERVARGPTAPLLPGAARVAAR